MSNNPIYQRPSRGAKGVIVVIILIGLATLVSSVATYDNTETAENAAKAANQSAVNKTLLDTARNDLATAQSVLDEVKRNAHEYRVRTEELHACLVELLLTIINTDESRWDEIANPCPEPWFNLDPPDAVEFQSTTSTNRVTQRARPRPRTPTENARAQPPPGTTSTTGAPATTTSTTTQPPPTTTTRCDVRVPTDGCVNP